MEKLDIRPLSGTIGAEVRNRTLAGIVESGRVDEIRQALLRYKVLFFTNQPDLSVETQIAFGRLFGELETNFPSFTAKPDGSPRSRCSTAPCRPVARRSGTRTSASRSCRARWGSCA